MFVRDLLLSKFYGANQIGIARASAESDTQKDLFSLMDDDPPPLPISTSSAFVTPNAGPRGVVSPPPSTAALRAPPAASSAPFDDDFFGTSAAVPQAAPAAPATPVPTGARSPPPPTPSQAQPFGDQDADYGNKQLQLNSTQKAVSDLQTKRGGLESAVSQNDSSIAELESRLATVRSTHETESKLVKDLEERQRMQSEELRKLREEVIRGESDLSALRAEKDEVEQAVMRDREDVRDMKRRMGEVQNETAQLKAQLEKLRKAARQQKGLLAIGKKQLSAAETDKETVARDITDVENGARPIEDVEASHTAAFGTSPAVASAVPLPETPAGVLSPAGSVRSTNPFDRFTSPGSAGRPDSPSFVKPEADTLARSATGEEHASGASAAVLGDAAGAAAALGLGGVAVAAREESNAHETQATNEGEDPFGVPSSAAPAPSHGATGFDDAFAVPEPSSHPVARPAEGSFDDNFADSFVPNSASGQAPQQGISEYASREATAESADFDDAFKNFGEQPLGRVARPSDGAGFDSTSAATSSSAPETAPVTSSDAILAEQAVGQHAPAPRADEVVTNTDVATLPPAVPPKVRDDAEDEASDADSSSDEEEGPEDVEGPRIGSPDEAGLGKSAGKAPVNELAKPGGGLGGLRSENSNAAANRFPELDSALDQEDLARSAQAQSAASEALAVPAAAPVSSLSSDQLMPGALTSEPEQDSAAPAVGSAISENAIKQQLTGATDGPDAFVDAATGETPQTAEFGNATIPVAAPASAAGALGGSHFSQRSDVGHERFATAFDEPFQTAPVPTALSTDVPTAAPVEGKSGSPSSSMKTRRDPPPRPVRNAAGGSTSTLPYPSTLSGADLGTRAGPQADTFEDSPFGNDFAPAQAPTQAPVTSAASTQQAGPQVASFDDFDSAFEDLGPAERQPAGAATSAAPDAGFDDAFDEGFDFVPSFAAPGAGSSAGANPTVGAPASAFKGTAAQNTSSAATQGFGFEDFDSTFEPAIKATGGPAGSVGAGPTASSVHNSQPGSGSGFSFDDAFGPTAPTPQLSAPAGSGLAPSLPPRSNTAGLGPTAAAGAGPEPPRVPARAPTGGPAKNANEPAPTPALPDDAPPVRQLCGMGFSRQQAIAALEKHNYRVERALEYLLARA